MPRPSIDDLPSYAEFLWDSPYKRLVGTKNDVPDNDTLYIIAMDFVDSFRSLFPKARMGCEIIPNVEYTVRIDVYVFGEEHAN